jgi:hypothetical protein
MRVRIAGRFYPTQIANAIRFSHKLSTVICNSSRDRNAQQFVPAPKKPYNQIVAMCVLVEDFSNRSPGVCV